MGYQSPTTTASYAYDALERRIGKTVDGAGTAYIYDMSVEDPLAHDDIALTFDTNGPPILTRRWVHSTAVDEPVGFEDYTTSSGAGSGSGTERLMFADRQGSILWVTEPVGGTVLAAYEYGGFGAITQTQGTLVQPYAYTGREYDAESGLYHYRARAFDPRGGAFLQSDPLGILGGDGHVYRYALNSPFNRFDPTGLQTTDAAVNTALVATLGTSILFTTAAVISLSDDIAASLGSLWDVLTPAEETVLTETSRPPGDDDECWNARLRKTRAQEIVNQLGQCVPSHSVPQRILRWQAYTQLGIARRNVTLKCYGGINDPGHEREIKEAFRLAGECGLL